MYILQSDKTDSILCCLQQETEDVWKKGQLWTAGHKQNFILFCINISHNATFSPLRGFKESPLWLLWSKMFTFARRFGEMCEISCMFLFNFCFKMEKTCKTIYRNCMKQKQQNAWWISSVDRVFQSFSCVQCALINDSDSFIYPESGAKNVPSVYSHMIPLCDPKSAPTIVMLLDK